MKTVIGATLVLVFGAAFALGAGSLPASAATLHQGKPYGCQVNSAACTTPLSITSVPPSQLPQTGGASSTPSPVRDYVPLGALAALLVLTGFAVRRRTVRER